MYMIYIFIVTEGRWERRKSIVETILYDAFFD